jgi:hypothetical protein
MNMINLLFYMLFIITKQIVDQCREMDAKGILP